MHQVAGAGVGLGHMAHGTADEASASLGSFHPADAVPVTQVYVPVLT